MLSALVFPAIFLIWASYYAWNDGSLSWKYKWQRREDAPGMFWWSISVLIAAAAFSGWLGIL